jgi:hypothetical protein
MLERQSCRGARADLPDRAVRNQFVIAINVLSASFGQMPDAVPGFSFAWFQFATRNETCIGF